MITFYALASDIAGLNMTEALALLPHDRRQKALRYRSEIDRRLCAYSYLLFQKAIQMIYELTYNGEFSYSEHGKPYMPEHPEIHFNLSHCVKGVACAVGDAPVGVDICEIRDFNDNMAARVLCTNEAERLRHADNKNACFAEIWSRKEAYLKMLGTGIVDGLRDVDTTALSITTQVVGDCLLSMCGGRFEGITRLTIGADYK